MLSYHKLNVNTIYALDRVKFVEVQYMGNK